MALREGLEFGTTVTTDSAPLHGMVATLLDALAGDVHVLRDPTRGGVASVLNEIAKAAGVGVSISEAAIPVAEEVRGACEILGLDPLYVANEGKLLAFVARERADEALSLLRAHRFGTQAAIIGEVSGEHPGKVVLRSRVGGRRVVDLLTGDQLPRIC
jgi:hydrogenase expression/formation protein HypE